MYASILVAVDLEHGAVGERILRLARHIVGPDGRTTLLYVAAVLPDFMMAHVSREALEAHHAEERAKLEALARAADPQAAVVVRQGGAPATIIEEARTLSVDAIVLGSHRPAPRDYLLGSTAARVVRHAQCSVIVDRGSA
jgi:nucleotide-binding universal stress UspA family protein